MVWLCKTTCGQLFRIWLSHSNLLGLPILFCISEVSQWWVANNLDKYDTLLYSCLVCQLFYKRVSCARLTAVCFKLFNHCTFKSFHIMVKLGVSHVHTGESCLCTWDIFFKLINGIDKLQIKVFHWIEISLSIHETFSPWTIYDIRFCITIFLPALLSLLIPNTYYCYIYNNLTVH